jgi:two-component system nitrogen regulation sensor histidine kinase NtrY
MSLRNKLLMTFSGIVVVSLVAVTWIVTNVTRHTFERINEDRTTALSAQFRREFERRGDEILQRLQAIAGSDRAIHMAVAVNRGQADYGIYLNDAKTIADSERLDLLEFVTGDGTIISSAQWPAKIGYKDSSVTFPLNSSAHAFLKPEELPEGNALSLSGVRAIDVGDKPVYVIGGLRLDQRFLASMTVPAGMRAFLYLNLHDGFSPEMLIDSTGEMAHGELLSSFIRQVQGSKQESTELVHWSSDAKEDETVHAVPLLGRDGSLLGILLIGSTRGPYVELRQRINLVALLVGGCGILLTIMLSGWAAGRITRPLRELAEATEDVSGGNWDTKVWITSDDEVGKLADSFNRMTRDLSDQKQRLVQTERVAAWRELARRLAHELKNPLFPLQLTVENLVRAREQDPQQFDEVFRESTAALLGEIRNLKNIISRFSDFSKMPQPVFQRIAVNELVSHAVRSVQPQWQASVTKIECRMELDEDADAIAADPDLLHRAISNLLLNAVDAMPEGGTLTVRTNSNADSVLLEICDTGKGLTAEECERLFTPYYTSKVHGTGLGLAIVQSIVADHQGRIMVKSESGKGSSFRVELPRNLDRIKAPETQTSRASV